jgi:hypothetical protein
MGIISCPQFLTQFKLTIMEWIDIDSIIVDETMTRSLNEIRKKESELDLNNIPPIMIDIKGKIVDGVKRYLVLSKLGYDRIPVNRINKRSKIHVSLIANWEQNHMLAA